MTLPAIKEMPKARPVCQWCGRPLKFFTNEEREQRSCDVGTFASGKVIGRTFRSWRGYPRWETPLFDTLRCSLSFATAAHLGGYRRKK